MTLVFDGIIRSPVSAYGENITCGVIAREFIYFCPMGPITKEILSK